MDARTSQTPADRYPKSFDEFRDAWAAVETRKGLTGQMQKMILRLLSRLVMLLAELRAERLANAMPDGGAAGERGDGAPAYVGWSRIPLLFAWADGGSIQAAELRGTSARDPWSALLSACGGNGSIQATELREVGAGTRSIRTTYRRPPCRAGPFLKKSG
jgi:hypothetical protein